MLREKVRIYVLARELGIESKDLIALCRQLGIEVLSQLTSIEPEQRDALVTLVSRQRANKTVPILAPTQPPRLPSSITPSGLGTLLPTKTKDKAEVSVLQIRQPLLPVANRGAVDGTVNASRLGRLRSLGRSLKLSSLERVKEQHAEDLLKSMRKAAETAARRAAKCPQRTPFSEAIRVLEERISEKSCCFLHHIRGMGNVAVHLDEACFTPEEVNYLTHALIVALEEMIAKRLL